MKLVGITGSGETTLNNANDLLRDYLPDDVHVFIPNYMTSDGIRIVAQWLREQEYYWEKVKRQNLVSFLLDEPDDSVLIVLGITGSEDIIEDCLNEGIPVLDLTRGLYRVSLAEIALDGAVSHAETTADETGTPDRVPDDLVLGSLPEPQVGDNRETVERWILEIVKQLVKEVKNLHVRVANMESNWEPQNMSLIVKDSDAGFVDSGAAPSTEGKTRYYQNGKGKIRKAGRSQIKPGEKEVWLTDEEAAEIN